MLSSERLVKHYETKYRAADFSSVAPVPLLARPADRRQMLVHLAACGPAGSYLEIGAGDGGTILSLLGFYERLVCTDLSEIRVQQLRLLFQNNSTVQVFRNNLEVDGLPFPDEVFHTAAMADVIEHFIDPIGALKEIRRTLKPGGRLIVLTPNIAKWTRRLKLLTGYFPSTASLQEGLLCYDKKTPTDLHDEGHLHYFTFRSLSRLALERAGFSRVEAAGYGELALSRVWPEMFSELAVILYR